MYYFPPEVSLSNSRLRNNNNIHNLTNSSHAGFRISLTGTALEQRATPQVVKKLKLVGTPTKIYKNSAFITGRLGCYCTHSELIINFSSEITAKR